MRLLGRLTLVPSRFSLALASSDASPPDHPWPPHFSSAAVAAVTRAISNRTLN